MARSLSDVLYCDNIGAVNTTSELDCCHLDDQNSRTCQENFRPGRDLLKHNCGNGSCIDACKNTTLLFSSLNQDDPSEGNGTAPIKRFLACVNIPAISRYSSQGLLNANISSAVTPFIPSNASDPDLRGISRSVTECLTQTCRLSRSPKSCEDNCAAVNLLTNSTTPSIEGVNGCLYDLCTNQYDSLPYADADVIGIGVFASYIMQCILVVLLCFGFFGFQTVKWHQRRKETASDGMSEKLQAEQQESSHEPHATVTAAATAGAPKSHYDMFKDMLDQFHNTQCYFSATIQIASLSYGIFDKDLLVTFELIPLATNGILPVVFVYVLLFRCGRATVAHTLLTVACWILASTVYWILYAHVIPINRDGRADAKYRAYQQFFYKLSALPTCGGYSALAVCPHNFDLGRRDIARASHNLRVLTPIIWSFSTVCLLVALAAKSAQVYRETGFARRGRRQRHAGAGGREGKTKLADGKPYAGEPAPSPRPSPLRSPSAPPVLYALAFACFLAGTGMQLSLLSIATSLKMMNRHDWGFGQIVAVTIWAPPILGWLYEEARAFLWDRFDVGREQKYSVPADQSSA